MQSNGDAVSSRLIRGVVSISGKTMARRGEAVDV
jgi:hypothetical protein